MENINGGSSVPNTETVIWANKCIAVGGAPTSAQFQAADRLISRLKISGIRSSITRLNMLGAPWPGCFVPLICDYGPSQDINNNFVTGDFAVTTGLQCATSKYVDLGVNGKGTVLGTNDAHMMLVNLVAAYDQHGIMGSIGPDGLARFTFKCNTGTNAADNSLVSTYKSFNGFTPSTKLANVGFFVSNVSSTTQTFVSRGNSLTAGTYSQDAALLPNQTLYFGACNLNGAAAGFFTSTVGGYSIGTGLSAANAKSYYTIVSDYATDIGRTIPV